MYANINGWRFNEHKQYTFLRKYGRDLLLFVVNFDHIWQTLQSIFLPTLSIFCKYRKWNNTAP